MFVKWIINILVALNSNVKKGQIAAGMAFGVLLALLPAGNLIWITLFVLIFFLRVHYGMEMLVMALLKLCYPLFANSLDALGWYVLHIQALRPLYIKLANMPIAPLTRFNNTLVAGGLAAGLVLWIPLFILFMFLVQFYRGTIAPKMARTKIYKAITRIPLVQSVQKAVGKVSAIREAIK